MSAPAQRSPGIASPGHAVFAVTMIFLGILGLRHGEFTPMWSGVPRAMSVRVAVAYLCALVSLISGIGLLWRRTAAAASRLLLIYLVLWALVVRLPYVLFHPTGTDAWWACGDTAVMLAAALVLHAWFTDERGGLPGLATGETGLRIARMLFGLALIPFGVAHFTYLQHTADTVPGWMPWHLAWACITGGAFVAAGVAILLGVVPRLAAVLTALMIGLFTVIVWVPIVVAGPSAVDWQEFINSVGLMAGSWVVADSYRGLPWLGRVPTLIPAGEAGLTSASAG